MDSKKPWQSKTLWVNFIGAVLALVGVHFSDFVQQNPQLIVLAFSIVNMGLRFATKGKIQLADDSGA